MTFSVTKEWSSGDTLTYTDLNQNFTDVETILNGGIKSDNISSSANITASQIQDRYHMVKTVIPIVPYACAAGGADDEIFSSTTQFKAPSSAATLFKHQIISNTGMEGFLYAIHLYVIDTTIHGSSFPTIQVQLNGTTIGQTITLATDDAHYKLHSNNPFTNPLVALSDGDVISVVLDGTGSDKLRGLTLTLFEKWRIAS